MEPKQQKKQFFDLEGGKTKSNAIEIPQISLPKGGGALKGIEEKFQVNAANRTAALSISLPITPGSSGFSPALSLSYNSGSRNGICGIGCSLYFPGIQRKTDKQLPRYRKTEGVEDVFMFSGLEDLVLHSKQDSEPIAGYSVLNYRPRIEGGFARIEKISHKTQSTYWRVTTRENVTTIFERSKKACISDPKDLSRIYQWLPEFSYDENGNWIQYHYKKDSNYDEAGSVVEDETIPHHLNEKNRKSRSAPYTNIEKSYLRQRDCLL